MVRKLLLPLAAAIGFIFGENVMAIEEPGFERLEKIENFEIRQYRPVVVAETFVEGDLSSASNIGFRRIADYIFGNNRSMLGTVSKPSEKITGGHAGPHCHLIRPRCWWRTNYRPKGAWRFVPDRA